MNIILYISLDSSLTKEEYFESQFKTMKDAPESPKSCTQNGDKLTSVECVAVSTDDTASELVRHEDLAYPTEEGKGATLPGQIPLFAGAVRSTYSFSQAA